jgi:hypothetical protein|tara:strand:- start:5556 stop:5816 length:261 start_codon:yes stop_codon:yes gene_type:complete
MKVGQIIKINKTGLASFTPAIRNKIEGEIGLVIQEKYDLAHRLDQDKLPEHIKVYPALVRFESLRSLNFIELSAVMVFPDQAEVLS